MSFLVRVTLAWDFYADCHCRAIHIRLLPNVLNSLQSFLIHCLISRQNSQECSALCLLDKPRPKQYQFILRQMTDLTRPAEVSLCLSGFWNTYQYSSNIPCRTLRSQPWYLRWACASTVAFFDTLDYLVDDLCIFLSLVHVMKLVSCVTLYNCQALWLYKTLFAVNHGILTCKMVSKWKAVPEINGKFAAFQWDFV